MPIDYPSRASSLNYLGLALSYKYVETGRMCDIQEAISCLQISLHQSSTDNFTRIVAGRILLHAYVRIQDWQQAYDASSTAVHFTSKLTARSLNASDKQHMLAKVVGLASDAAAAALHAGKGPLNALALLEEGRGILATSLEDMRIEVGDLQDKHPDLAMQFARLREELDQPINRNVFTAEETSNSWQAQASQRYKRGTELDALILKIRQQSGFENFLLPPNEGDMRAAAGFGPIVVINVSPLRCDAIIIEPQQIRLLPLPGLSFEAIAEKVKESNLGCPRILEWLWDAFASAILDSLGFKQPPGDDDWPHIWWIPTGVLTKFPLHAAGYHSTGSKKAVMDRVMSSYSSSIKAIIHGRRRNNPEVLSTSSKGKALLVSMQNTPGCGQLPCAADEVAVVQHLCESMGIKTIKPEPRKSEIIQHLPESRLFHFAGHGYTDHIDPSESHLALADWQSNPLTVGSLLEINLRQQSPFLAYLSACGTGGIRDQKFMDENVHLISACQLAGFRHVIGTLWDVNDSICVDMAKITYEVMMVGGMSDKSLCLGLHEASRELRNRWLNDGPRRDATLCESSEEMITARWAPYVHYGI
ncbi:hypothetical protein QQS21_002265 [Conoideocrella luteorostrata]|uniref:CHAT domain-containing protein n=1 Tax=Conoideocrella luteorostrata TaxID=1105319 RepID=A0AAJ0FXG2_9HYPO|nr:hypothetical protein QQS21_002265 [Conoideocrella luteorostrata]